MVVPGPINHDHAPTCVNGTINNCIPVIDMREERSALCGLMIKACEELGFFQVKNHGVSSDVISRVEDEGKKFFSRPASEKLRAGPATPFGYGCKDIGFNGDKGDLEYLLLEANPRSVSLRSKSIAPSDSKIFSYAVNDYIEGVRKLACDILDILAQGLLPMQAYYEEGVNLSNLIQDANSDSCFRINHYPTISSSSPRIGFGEHSDPQILTILRSNEVGGLQILSRDGISWIPVPPDSDKFCVFIGDAFHALTNGRFVSVRHRAELAPKMSKPRMSIMYFAAPPLEALISPLPQLVSFENPSKYRPFTWGEYKKTVYSLKLADDRLDLFKNSNQ
ncbi:gibberellin 2-beta-dioxygenase 6-like [Primulina eburnea]|uniref:gibberellin 2-beta-dioxygenase 6-like n=1 Tax=Primulina eburnea TaxID=1245227 RepID=UPI003C6BEA6C